VVGSARAALAAIMVSVPQMIVTELDLPDADGLELVARWRTDPLTRHTLLMIVTRRRSVRDKIAGLQAGADDYLVKAVDPYVFAMHVQSVSRFRKVLKGF
jgi:DNA-binding response OmpR family regulator